MCDNIACIGSGGCVESFPNGSSGQILAIDPATNQPAWIDQVDGHPAATVAAGSNPALSIVAATQVATLDLDAAGSYTNTNVPVANRLTSTSVQDAIDELAPCRVCSIDSENDCAAGGTVGGIGPDYQLREATLAGGVLTLNSRARVRVINSLRARRGVFTTQGTVPNQPAFTDQAADLVMTLTNPSPCLNALAYISAFTNFSFLFGAGFNNAWYARMTLQIDNNGTPSSYQGPLGYSIGANSVVTAVERTQPTDIGGLIDRFDNAVILAAGGTLTVTLNIQLQTLRHDAADPFRQFKAEALMTGFLIAV